MLVAARRRRHGRRDRRPAVPVRGHGAQLPVLGDRQDGHAQPGRSRSASPNRTAGSDRGARRGVSGGRRPRARSSRAARVVAASVSPARQRVTVDSGSVASSRVSRRTTARVAKTSSASGPDSSRWAAPASRAQRTRPGIQSATTIPAASSSTSTGTNSASWCTACCWARPASASASPAPPARRRAPATSSPTTGRPPTLPPASLSDPENDVPARSIVSPGPASSSSRSRNSRTSQIQSPIQPATEGRRPAGG